MDLLEVTQKKDFKFTIKVRDHVVEADMRKEDGGEDTGPNPIELLVGALSACIGMTIRVYCKMHNLPAEGIVVNAVPTLEAPKRLKNVAIDIALPEGFPEDKRDSVMRVAHKCPVHKALTDPPGIDMDFA